MVREISLPPEARQRRRLRDARRGAWGLHCCVAAAYQRPSSAPSVRRAVELWVTPSRGMLVAERARSQRSREALQCSKAVRACLRPVSVGIFGDERGASARKHTSFASAASVEGCGPKRASLSRNRSQKAAGINNPSLRCSAPRLRMRLAPMRLILLAACLRARR